MVAIGHRDYSNRELTDLESDFASGKADVRRFVVTCVGTNPTYPDIKTAMTQLESVAQENKQLALLLMTGLYDIADDARAHDVCDAIDLWIENAGDAALADLLQTARSPAIRTPEWISDIRRRQR